QAVGVEAVADGRPERIDVELLGRKAGEADRLEVVALALGAQGEIGLRIIAVRRDRVPRLGKARLGCGERAVALDRLGEDAVEGRRAEKLPPRAGNLLAENEALIGAGASRREHARQSIRR